MFTLLSTTTTVLGVMLMDRRQHPGSAMIVSVVLMLLVIVVVATPDNVCPPSCRCQTVDADLVVACVGVGRVPSPLPPATTILDVNHNRISLLTNSSFSGTRAAALRRLVELRLEDNGLLYLEAGALAPLTELRVLRLGRNHLSSLATGVFDTNRKLTILDVHANYLTTLPDAVVRHLHSLSVINASFNHLTSPRLGPEFRFTTQLSYIDLSGNDFRSIESDVFSVAQWWDGHVARHINLSYCGVRHIGQHVFQPIPRLRSVSLSGNLRLAASELETALSGVRGAPASLQSLRLSHANISDVQTLVRSLQTTTSVSHLELAYNRIRTVPQKTFVFMSALRQLDLSHNELVAVDGVAGLNQLEYLNLAFNNLERIEEDTFEGLSELRYLDVSHNAIVGELDAEPLLNLFSLRHVDISGNRVRSIVIETGGLENLETLSAAWNGIADVRFLARLPRLRRLDLSRNAVAHLPDNLFPFHQRVDHVNFSGNAISELTTNSLLNATVGVIDLSWNRLTTLNDPGWKSVDKLLLHDNELEVVKDMAFTKIVETLTEIHLQRNHLNTPPQPFFATSSTANHSFDDAVLRLLDLSENPLGVNLQKSFVTASFRGSLEVLRLQNVGLAAWPSSVVRRLGKLKTLDISENQISIIPAGSLVNLASLRHLDVSLNHVTFVDPWTLTSRRPLPSIDLSGNPFYCSCSLTSFCRFAFPAPVPDDQSAVRLNSTAVGSRTSYQCHAPTEWAHVDLAAFCTDTDDQCSLLPSTLAAAAVGSVAFVVGALLSAVMCRRCVERCRNRGAASGAAKAKEASAMTEASDRCLFDNYQFIDETSLTSSSNSSAATTTSAIPGSVPCPFTTTAIPSHSLPLAFVPQRTLHPCNTTALGVAGRNSMLLSNAKQWL